MKGIEEAMTPFPTLTKTNEDTVKDTRSKALDAAQSTYAGVQDRVQTGMTLGLGVLTAGAEVLQDLLRKRQLQKKAQKRMGWARKKARKNLGGLQDSAQASWEKAQDVLLSGMDSAQNALQSSVSTAQGIV